MSANKMMFLSWEHYTITLKQNLKCKECIHLFESTNNFIQNNLSAIMKTAEYALR